MSQCPITYASCSPEKYSQQGLKKLNRGLSLLLPFDASKIMHSSDSGISNAVWPFASALGRVNARRQSMEPVRYKGKFFLFPPSKQYAQIPQNLDLSLRLAQRFGLPVPFHGLIHDEDGTMTCFVELPATVQCLHPISARHEQENSLEFLVARIEESCTFPVLEKYKLFQRVLFSWLTGFETQDISCFAFQKVAHKIELAQASLFFNSILPLGTSEREFGLSVGGKKRGFSASDFRETIARDLLGLNAETVEFLISGFQKNYLPCRELVMESFLSEDLKEQYLDVIVGRLSRLNA